MKVDIYIHRTKATSYIRHATSSKKTSAWPNLESNAYCFLQWDLNPQLWMQRTFRYNRMKSGESWHMYPSNKDIRHATSSKNSCITKPGIEHLLFLAVGFEPATVDSRELYAPTERRVVKFGVYTHRTKAASQTRRETISKKELHDQAWTNVYGF